MGVDGLYCFYQRMADGKDSMMCSLSLTLSSGFGFLECEAQA